MVDAHCITVIAREVPNMLLRAAANTNTLGLFRWTTDWGASGLEEAEHEHLTWIRGWPAMDSPEVHALRAAYALASPMLRLP